MGQANFVRIQQRHPQDFRLFSTIMKISKFGHVILWMTPKFKLLIQVKIKGPFCAQTLIQIRIDSLDQVIVYKHVINDLEKLIFMLELDIFIWTCRLHCRDTFDVCIKRNYKISTTSQSLCRKRLFHTLCFQQSKSQLYQNENYFQFSLQTHANVTMHSS